MWKVLFFLACLGNFDVGSCDYEKCGTNERYVACPDTMCIPRNCSQRGLPVPCPVLGPEGRCPGKPACICIDSYLRDDATGECIPSKKCKLPSTTAAPSTEPTESLSCCAGVDFTPRCGKNEVYNNCSYNNNCGPYLCSELGFPLDCKNCKPGCICKDGYLRDNSGVCIPINNCPSCGGDKNAVSGCGNNCGKTCTSYNPKPAACSFACVENGCDCRDGFAYDSNVKSCVRLQDCTPICKVNEEYSSCINGGCYPRNCSEVGQSKICIDPITCIKGCVCVKGYLRASNGTCVPTNQCPQPPTTTAAPITKPTDKPKLTPRCGKNEVYNNCSHNNNCGPYLCSELGFPLDCKNCKPGCICKDGFLRDDSGVCIPINNCPSCGGDKNAVSGCGNNCGKTCTSYNPKPAACSFACVENGCDCRDGFAYDSNVKSCVRLQDCTPICKVNEEYSSCINGGCYPRNCSEVGQSKICIDPITCIKGCVCVKGYLRASNGTCVPTNQCPQPPTTTAAPITKPTDKPKLTPRCGKNEVYNNCSHNNNCGPYLCSELGFPLDCKNCKPGCICKDGFLRDDSGVCIPINNCPSCGGDKNAVSGCGNNCGKTCTSYNPKPAACSFACVENGCDCRDGFAYDSNVKSCVRLQDCTPICKVNEEYSSCINGGCYPRNCSEVGQSKICIDPITCIKGCVCVKGYLRASNGTCVPTNQCPQPPTTTAAPITKPTEKPTPDCPPGEVWSTCPTVKCDGDNCPKTRDSPQTCPVGIVCDKPRCVCGYNRKRDRKTGKCIPIPDCPPFKCDSNEEYQACSSSCPGEKCSDYINKTTCPPYRIGIIVNCRPACKCIKGYFRNADGKCVPACECDAGSPVKKP